MRSRTFSLLYCGTVGACHPQFQTSSTASYIREIRGVHLETIAMNEMSRREFLESTGTISVGLTAGVAAMALGRRAHAVSVNDRVRLAVVGIHGRGGHLAKKFAARADCEIAYLCDVDEPLLAPNKKDVEQIQGGAPKVTGDFRRALDDQTVDAIIIATPDHWHAL